MSHADKAAFRGANVCAARDIAAQSTTRTTFFVPAANRVPRSSLQQRRDALCLDGLDNSFLGNQCRNKLGGCDVEGGVIYVDAQRGRLFAHPAGDFFCRALFDGDLIALGQREVERRTGGGDIERDLMRCANRATP